MKFYDSIIIISLVLTSYMLVSVYINHNMNKRNKRDLFVAYLILGIIVFSEWIGDIMKEYKIIKVIELSLTPVFPIIYANVVLNDIKTKNSETRNMIKNMLYLLLIFHALLERISCECRLGFYAAENGYLYYGKLYIIYVITYMISLIYFYSAMLKFNKYFQSKNIVSLIGIGIVGGIGSIIQLIKPELKVGWLCFIIASVLVYMYYTETAMYIDNLTGLLNQSAYKKRLELIRKTVIILLFDVDSFKTVNDNYGHNFGDLILSIIGEEIKKIYGQYGYCYRIGGDEFCVILSNSKEYKRLNSEFVLELERNRKNEPRLPYVSIGCTEFNPKIERIEEAIERADADLYYWKEELKKKRSK